MADEQLLLTFGEFSIAVRSADARLLQRLRTYFQAFVTPDGAESSPRTVIEASLGETTLPDDLVLRPWDARGKESFADVDGGRLVRKDRTGVIIRIKRGRWSVNGDLHRRFSQLVNAIGTAYGIAMLDEGGAMLHSSAVVRDGLALAVVGQSGSGKSSVAVRLLEQGCDFMTNDRLIVEPAKSGMLGHGLPKLPRVNPGTLLAGERTRTLVDEADRRRYGRLSAEELWRLEEKYDLDVRRTLGRRWVLAAPLVAAFLLEWRRVEEPLRLERLDAGRALESLRGAAKSFGPFDLALSERTDAAFHALAHRVPVYRVTGAADPTGLARRLAASDWADIETV